MKKFLSTMRVNSRRKSSRNTFYIGSVILGGGLLLLFFVPFILGYIVAFLMMPVAYVQNWFVNSGQSIPVYLREQTSLIQENKELKEQISIIQKSETLAALIDKEPEILEDVSSAEEGERIMASLVSRPGAFPYDVFLINKGSGNGVTVGAPVYVGDWQAVGFIAKTYSKMSLVVLATSPSYESIVYIYGPDIYTRAVGQGGGVLRVSVPQGITLQEGDPVLIPALHTGLYGEISYIESTPSEPEQYGYVSIETPLNSIRTVTVGNNALTEMSFEEARDVVRYVKQDVLTVSVPDGVLVEVASSTAATDSEEVIDEFNESEI